MIRQTTQKIYQINMNIKLLKNLEFAEKINKTEAVTEAGKEMLSRYRGYVYTNPVTFGVVNSFINEAQKFSFDTGLVSILESVLSVLNDNKISWKLASACEALSNNNSTYGYIAKIGVQQVEKLLEMNEAEVVSYIKAGSLKGIQYIPEFRAICKEVYKSSVNEANAPTYKVTCPFCYVHIVEGKDKYVSILGKTFKIDENSVNEASCDNVKFNEINALLKNFSLVDENLVTEYKGTHGDVCTFTLSEGKLQFTKGEIKEEFTTPDEFLVYANNSSKIMPIHEKMNWMNAANVVAKVFEAMDSIVVLDCAKVLETSTGTICAIVEGKDNVNLTVFRSIGCGTSSKNYEYVVEALQNMTKVSGIDLRPMFEARIDEECKTKDPEKYNMIKEELAAQKNQKINDRKKKIAMLAEQYKNDPVKITLLNKAAKELAILENKD